METTRKVLNRLMRGLEDRPGGSRLNEYCQGYDAARQSVRVLIRGELRKVAFTPSTVKLSAKAMAQAIGALTVLSATTGLGISTLIKSLAGTAWTEEEAAQLLKASKAYESLNNKILNEQ